ncbi:helix-turn-helix domain-containing protein [Sunxiuqinia sp. sy24]|uniref:helix-turn-helix domain-containing protein n=1 Tax=Sunxiuqinia sp. sy24 TaxID=3461495 RepID=UPI0040467A2A
MQEIIRLVSSLKKDIEQLRSEVTTMKKSHVQVLKEEWIPKEQAMQILKMGDRTFQKLKHGGKIPYAKINGIHLFRTTDIEQLLEANYRYHD